MDPTDSKLADFAEISVSPACRDDGYDHELTMHSHLIPRIPGLCPRFNSTTRAIVCNRQVPEIVVRNIVSAAFSTILMLFLFGPSQVGESKSEVIQASDESSAEIASSSSTTVFIFLVLTSIRPI